MFEQIQPSARPAVGWIPWKYQFDKFYQFFTVFLKTGSKNQFFTILLLKSTKNHSKNWFF